MAALLEMFFQSPWAPGAFPRDRRQKFIRFSSIPAVHASLRLAHHDADSTACSHSASDNRRPRNNRDPPFQSESTAYPPLPGTKRTAHRRGDHHAKLIGKGLNPFVISRSRNRIGQTPPDGWRDRCPPSARRDCSGRSPRRRPIYPSSTRTGSRCFLTYWL